MTEEGDDSSGHGEGQELLDTIITATGANGDSPTFTCTSSAPAVGDKVSATATNTATPPSSPERPHHHRPVRIWHSTNGQPERHHLHLSLSQV
jgi:hypothetical protein